jgi:hypothetical protein
MAKPVEIQLRPGWLDDDIRRAQRHEPSSSSGPLRRVFTTDSSRPERRQETKGATRRQGVARDGEQTSN